MTNSPEEMRSIEGACVDTGRATRCGFGEVIYGEGKSTDLVGRIAEQLLTRQPQALITRIATESARELVNMFPYAIHVQDAKTLRLSQQPIIDLEPKGQGDVIVITAGSTDRGVALEAVETLKWMNVPCRLMEDLGVAGPQRLLSVVPQLRECAVIVVAAGMEGALPSVVAGHVDCPVIGLPTSVGYGASLGGLTAMLSMMTSCAAGVAVVNIDAGFKAGYLAGMIASRK